MKKVTAFALLLIFLINIGGYSIIYRMAHTRAAKELTAKLDRDEFSGSQAITIKIPVSLPYQPDRDFERIDGEFEYQGQYYRLVKQRVLGDTLHVVCVIDDKKKELVDEMNTHTRMTSESSSTNQSLKIINSNPLQEYSQGYVFELTSSSFGWVSSFGYADYTSSPIDPFQGINSPPPRA